MEINFPEHYARISDDELLHIAAHPRNLRDDARVALNAEMARRGLTHEQAHAKKREHLRRDIEEARGYRSKRNKSKYFVRQMNTGACLVGMAGLAVTLALMMGHVRDEVLMPLYVMCVGALIACLAVQSWVRWTVSFWISLATSFIPQFFVARWFAVHSLGRSTGGTKGLFMVSIFAGYLVGGSVFVLLQKLKPAKEAEEAS